MLGALPLSAADVDTALIESVILVNFDALASGSAELLEARIRRADVDTVLIDATLPNAVAYSDTATLQATFGALLDGHTDTEIAIAVQYAFDYTLNAGITTFGLDLEAATNALEIFTKVAFEASDQRDTNNGEDAPNPKKLAENLARPLLIGNPSSTPATPGALEWAITNNQHVPTVGREVAKAISKGAISATIINATVTEIAETLISELTGGALDVLESAATDGVGFYKGITPVTEGVDNGVMLYDGTYKKFHPDKARLIEYVVNGSTYGILEAAIAVAGNDISSISKAIGAKAAESAVTQFNSLAGDNSLFLYETVKAIGYGTSMGSVLVAGSLGSGASLAQSVAENISYGVASGSVEKVLSLGLATADIAKVGEAVAYGTAMGTGLAGSMLKGFDRAALVQFAAQGAAQGAMVEAANKKGNTETENDELLALARGTSMGSVLGSVAMAVYDHLDAYEVDIQQVIELAALGTAYGTMTSDLVNDDGSPRDKLPGHKEDFEVELARAVANGASTGALFEITALLQTQPDVRAADIDSIKTAKSVSYGTTKGAILGGDAAGISSDVSVKQATEQGLTEGSMDGVALALGFAEDKVNEATIRSENAIMNAVGAGNRDGAIDAARSLAIKAINPTVEDMRQLMKLYGINPKLTNPGFIFPNPNNRGEENFLFPADEIPIVSPI
ncbi:MAG: hypothetical protein AAEJ57_06110 [Opitutales bacterium]